MKSLGPNGRGVDDEERSFRTGRRLGTERFLKEFQERLAKFRLEVHPDRTRLIAFGREAWRNRKRPSQAKLETFTFLGFTHRCGKNSKGYFQVWREHASTLASKGGAVCVSSARTDLCGGGQRRPSLPRHRRNPLPSDNAARFPQYSNRFD